MKNKNSMILPSLVLLTGLSGAAYSYAASVGTASVSLITVQKCGMTFSQFKVDTPAGVMVENKLQEVPGTHFLISLPETITSLNSATPVGATTNLAQKSSSLTYPLLPVLPMVPKDD